MVAGRPGRPRGLPMLLTQGDSSSGLMPAASLLGREIVTAEKTLEMAAYLDLSFVILASPLPSLALSFPL